VRNEKGAAFAGRGSPCTSWIARMRRPLVAGDGTRSALQRPMAQWEYKRVKFEVTEVPKPVFEKQLCDLGSAGWELVAAVQHEIHGHSHEVYFVFKRACAPS